MTKRNWAFFGALLCFTALAVAYFYFQQYVGLPPCPLCILDRIIIGTLGVVFLLLAYSRSSLIKFLGFLTLIAGFAVGGRHVWLERFSDPSDAVSCVPGGGAKDLIEWVTSAFIGTSDCSIIFWQLWGLSIADLTLILYVVLALIFLRSRRGYSYSRNIFS